MDIGFVQITAAESLGVETRAAFYENTGAVRDMIQSDVLQLTSLVALEPPSAFDAVAARLSIDNWRWADVPFYIRTGKRLARSVTEIAIQFRRAPHLVFRGQDLDPNALVLNLQPEEGISICFHAKLPDPEMRLKDVTMDFSYRRQFGVRHSAYTTLLNDCMRGDATLFDRADGLEAAWALVDPILQSWRSPNATVPTYAAGSWGPRESGELLERDGRRWRKP